MKIFFTASLRGTKEYGKFYKQIYKEIENLGYNHLDEEVLTLTKEEYYNRIEKIGRNAYVDLYKRKTTHLQQSDICVFECSIHSLSIGFLVQKSLDFNKPTIVLYLNDHVPHFLAGIDDEKLILKSYKDTNVTKVLKDALEEARERRDKRFNFFISPKLLTYLENTSKGMGITKSKFIRNLLLEHMKKYTS